MPDFDLSTLNLKNVVIAIAAVYAISLSGFLIYNSLKIVTPIVNYGSLTTIDTPETGTHTACESNKDCWCRKYDGAKMYPGKVQHVCNKETNTCNVCVYE